MRPRRVLQGTAPGRQVRAAIICAGLGRNKCIPEVLHSRGCIAVAVVFGVRLEHSIMTSTCVLVHRRGPLHTHRMRNNNNKNTNVSPSKRVIRFRADLFLEILCGEIMPKLACGGVLPVFGSRALFFFLSCSEAVPYLLVIAADVFV